MYGCSAIEMRSPIVFRKPKPQEPTPSTERASTPSPSKEIKVVEQSPAQQGGEAVVKGEPVSPATKISEKFPSKEYKTDILSPANIPILSNQDLTDYRFSFLGRIEVRSPSKDGFTQEKALQNLKVEAFKRYSSLAQGIINIKYKKKSDLLSMNQDVYEEISGDVITLAKKTAVAPEEGSGTIPAVTGQSGGISTQREVGEIPPLSNILIFSSDDLFHLNFKILGIVNIIDQSRKGFSEEQAIRDLKIEAFRLYGIQAKALTRIKLVREALVFYYKKTRSVESPSAPKGFIKASAEVVTWSSD
jgi:hypothetical protein